MLFSDSLCTCGFARSSVFRSCLSFACFTTSPASALIAVLFGLHLAQRFFERIRHTPEGLADFDHALGFPILLITQHRPSDDGNLASQSHSGFLFAGLQLATDSFIDFFSPRVVTQRCPCAFNQDRSSQWISALGNAAIAICLAGLILARNQAEVSGDLSTVFETMRIVDTSDEDLSCARSDARYGSDAFDARTSLPMASSFLTTSSSCALSASSCVSSISSSGFHSSFGPHCSSGLRKESI